MLYDYQHYASLYTTPIIPRPTPVPSTTLFQVISMALGRNLNDYLQKKKQIEAQNEQITQEKAEKPKTIEKIVINLESEEENNWPVTVQQKDINSQTLKQSPIHESLLDTDHKDEILGTDQIEFVSQNSQQFQKRKSSEKAKEKEQDTLSARCMKKFEACQQFTLYSVQCPKLGLSNSQLLRKKEKLLRRKVVDWSEVDQKGPKQRRQIRMLNN